jgi:hypothetical protein
MAKKMTKSARKAWGKALDYVGSSIIPIEYNQFTRKGTISLRCEVVSSQGGRWQVTVVLRSTTIIYTQCRCLSYGDTIHQAHYVCKHVFFALEVLRLHYVCGVDIMPEETLRQARARALNP